MARIDKSNNVKNIISTKNNFASLYGGASIIEKNPGSINTKSILDDNSDKYLQNMCSTKNKYVVISLKEDININGFAIINTEFYSSNVKDIAVYGSNEYPIEQDKDWVELGLFRLENVYEWQYFNLKTMWARYVRIEFRSHYEYEYYCTITQIKVFGSPILADFKKDFVTQKRIKKEIESNQKQVQQTQTQVSTEDKQKQNKEVKHFINILEHQTPQKYQEYQQQKTSIDVFKIIESKMQQKKFSKPFDWKDIYQCLEEEGLLIKQQELEFEQSQSIFKILTNNIDVIFFNSFILMILIQCIQQEIRGFIDKQSLNNQFFNEQIEKYKSSLSNCNIDKQQIQEMNRQQMEYIEDLYKIYQNISRIVITFCIVLFLLVFYKLLKK